jgi:thioredoxin reductase
LVWEFVGGCILAIAAIAAMLQRRRAELAKISHGLEERERARAKGTHRARLQHPHIDLARCMGCGTCVRACPEDGVLELIHGQAMVVHGARCVGHGKCAVECPVGAIAITLADLEERRDIPVLTESLESTRVRGLFLAGEVTGYALIRTAVAQGTAVADEVARRAREPGEHGPSGDSETLDLVVIGAGPAGFACSLEAKKHGLAFVTLDQSDLGGTVSKYPRRKLVMTQPVSLPLHGLLERSTYEKEELVELWNEVAVRHALPIRTGVEFKGLDRAPDGTFLVDTSIGRYHARSVCLALGRRGTPRKLEIQGEELPKVAYSLVDAQSYTHRRVLVVGGGDSAVEAALGLSEQEGNEVWLSYRKSEFTRLRSRNESRLAKAVGAGRIVLLLESEVTVIEPEFVHVRVKTGEVYALPNDDVFVMVGGTPPFPLLEAAGVSFDPADRAAVAPVAREDAGLSRALLVVVAVAIAAMAWTLCFYGYYHLDASARLLSPRHELLRSGGTIGIATGVATVLLIIGNLAYLVRRSHWFSRWSPWVPGSLRGWMNSHVATGICALFLVLVHAAMAPRHTVGGHALVALAILVGTGAIGRYFYSFVPRAANGRELLLDEVKAQLASLSGEWDRQSPSFAAKVRDEIQRLTSEAAWQTSFVRRVAGLLTSHRRLHRTLDRLRVEAKRVGIGRDQLQSLFALAERAQRTSLMAAHYEDLRGILASWRYLHRWVALAMVLLAAVHVYNAWQFGGLH